MAVGIEKTSFTLDVIGRFTCNTDTEALAATRRPYARPFDVIVVGGGSFGPILAENVYFDDKSHSRRVLVLEAGPMVLPEHQQNLPVLGGDIEKLVRDVPWAATKARLCRLAGSCSAAGRYSLEAGRRNSSTTRSTRKCRATVGRMQ